MKSYKGWDYPREMERNRKTKAERKTWFWGDGQKAGVFSWPNAYKFLLYVLVAFGVAVAIVYMSIGFAHAGGMAGAAGAAGAAAI